MKEQTAMQTLIEELKDYKRTTHSDKLVIIFWITMAEKLLQKEKEQIMNAWYNGFEENRPYVDHSEDYYNEIYKQY